MGKQRRSRFFIDLLILTSSFFSSAVIAEKNNGINIQIINHGIYAHSPDNGKTWINPVSDKKVIGKSTSPVHLKSTREVPAQYPLFFGFEYQLDNLKDEIAVITTEVNHPEIKNAEGKKTTSYQEENKFLVLDGKLTGINGYLLENRDEITPGKWTFKIKHKGKTIIQQTFNVIAEQ